MARKNDRPKGLRRRQLDLVCLKTFRLKSKISALVKITFVDIKKLGKSINYQAIKKKKKNLLIHLAGNTVNSHSKFVSKLTRRGAKLATSPEAGDALIVFCPIVSRFESDIEAALCDVDGKNYEVNTIIFVAMHHTRNKNYPLIENRGQISPKVQLLVDCLFHETKGLFSCPRNKQAVKMVRKELGLPKKNKFSFMKSG